MSQETAYLFKIEKSFLLNISFWIVNKWKLSTSRVSDPLEYIQSFFFDFSAAVTFLNYWDYFPDYSESEIIPLYFQPISVSNISG